MSYADFEGPSNSNALSTSVDDDLANSYYEEESKPVIIKGEETGHVCSVCNKSYQKRRTLLSHLRNSHGVDTGHLLKIFVACNHQECLASGVKFGSTAHYRRHLHDKHNAVDILHSVQYAFKNMQEFMEWKSIQEKNDIAQFVALRGGGSLNRGCVVYSCNRSGVHCSIAKGKRKLKEKGSRKCGFICPASIVLKQEEEKLIATYYPTHYGHEKDVKYLSLTQEEKLSIAEDLFSGMSTTEIMQKFRAANSDATDRVRLLTPRDISNIRAAYKVFNNTPANTSTNQTTPSPSKKPKKKSPSKSRPKLEPEPEKPPVTPEVHQPINHPTTHITTHLTYQPATTSFVHFNTLPFNQFSYETLETLNHQLVDQSFGYFPYQSIINPVNINSVNINPVNINPVNPAEVSVNHVVNSTIYEPSSQPLFQTVNTSMLRIPEQSLNLSVTHPVIKPIEQLYEQQQQLPAAVIQSPPAPQAAVPVPVAAVSAATTAPAADVTAMVEMIETSHTVNDQSTASTKPKHKKKRIMTGLIQKLVQDIGSLTDGIEEDDTLGPTVVAMLTNLKRLLISKRRLLPTKPPPPVFTPIHVGSVVKKSPAPRSAEKKKPERRERKSLKKKVYKRKRTVSESSSSSTISESSSSYSPPERKKPATNRSTAKTVVLSHASVKSEQTAIENANTGATLDNTEEINSDNRKTRVTRSSKSERLKTKTMKSNDNVWKRY